MILRTGLTGGIGAGKTTVARLLAGLGCFVVDADRIVSDLYRPGAPGFAVVVEHYGRGILDSRGELDRAKLAKIAFSSNEEAARLNSLIHPLVIAREEKIIEDEIERFPESHRIVVVEATLLIEAGGRERYDRIIVVDARPEIQLKRARERGMRKADVERRMSRQMAREDRLAAADFVIHNDGDMVELEREVVRVHAMLSLDLERLVRGEELEARERGSS